MLVGGGRKIPSAHMVVEQLVLLLLETDRPEEIFFLPACFVQVQEACQSGIITLNTNSNSMAARWTPTLDEERIIVRLAGGSPSLAEATS